VRTWTLVAHGITENPNDLPVVTVELSKYQGISTRPMDVGGIENKIALDSARVHSPHLSANAPEIADISSTSSASGSCIRASISAKCLGWCLFILVFLQLTRNAFSLPSLLDETKLCCANLCSSSSRSSDRIINPTTDFYIIILVTSLPWIRLTSFSRKTLI